MPLSDTPLCCLCCCGRYASYTTIYLNDDTKDNVKGMAEMTLIKLGEIVDKPQAKRIQLMARQIEEAKRAEEARQKREAARKVAGEPAVRPQQVARSSGLSCFRPTQVKASQNGCARHAAAQLAKLLASSCAERQVEPLHPARLGWSSMEVWTA